MRSKNFKIAFLLLFAIEISYAQVGIGNTDPKATLDITAAYATGTLTPNTIDGILIPRVTRERAQSMTAASITTSTLIYISEVITGTATGTAVNITTVGFYFFNGTAWEKITTGTSTAGWGLTGNGGTSPGTNFLGTTGTEDIRIKTNNTDRWNISHSNAGQLQSYSLGSATTPIYSFQGDQNTGIFSSGADALDFTTGGTARLRIPNANQIHALSLGTAALPFYTFSNDTNTGMWSSAGDVLDFSTAGNQRIQINADGTVGINDNGTATNQVNIYSRSSTKVALYADSSTGVAADGAEDAIVSRGNNDAGYGAGWFINDSNSNGSGYGSTQMGYALLGETNATSGTYKVGVMGTAGNGRRNAGVMGMINATYVGALAYRPSAGATYYGGYFMDVNGGVDHIDGTGRLGNTSNSEQHLGIGIGSLGGYMGGWIKGRKYGLTLSGKDYGLFVDGDTYVTQNLIKRSKIKSNEVITSYAVFGMQNEINAKGKSKLDNGNKYIAFDENFSKVIDNAENLIINLTAMGNCKGLYVERYDSKGFYVREMEEQTSNVVFSWSASYLTDTTASEVLPTNYEETLSELMIDESKGQPQIIEKKSAKSKK